jgi:hypothetical protein
MPSPGALVLFAVAIILAHITTDVYAAKKADKGGGGASRLAVVSKKAASPGVVPLDEKNFSRYIIERPRMYNAAIVFTALGSQYGCSVCLQVAGSYNKVAEYYKGQYDFDTVDPQQKVVFFIVDVDGARRIFEEMKFETVPRMFVLPPREEGSAKLKMTDYEVDLQNVIEGGPKPMLSQIEDLVGVKV